MKIEAILEIIEPQVRSYDMSNRTMHQRTSGEHDSQYGSPGIFSTVSSDRDPHFVKKTSKDSVETKNDGYWFFIKNVVDHKLWENPYFPRVYQFKEFYKGDEVHYRVQLEKLIPYSNLSVKEALAVFERVTGKDSSNFFNEPNVNIVASMITNFMENVWANEISLETVDANLVSAMQEMQEMNPNGMYYRYDLHMSNLMYRRGPHGVHPVIIDPFSFKAHS